jgi:hypothetical protein
MIILLTLIVFDFNGYFIIPGIIISLMLSFNFYKDNKEVTYTTTETKIYSLKDAGSDISGTFFLGSGIINSTPQYSMFIDSEEGSKKKHFVNASALIFEGISPTNRHEQITCEPGSEFSFFLGFQRNLKDCEYNTKDKLFVPTGTITNKFSI